MANINEGFRVEILSLQDETLVTAGTFDPRVLGYEAPEGSLFAYKNGPDSTVFVKTGGLDTDWSDVTTQLPPGGNPGDYLVKASLADYDFQFIDRVQASGIRATAKNTGLTTLVKGTPVYATGGTLGTALHVEAADAAEVNKMPAVGVVWEDIAPEGEGELLILGEILGMDTSAFAEGDLIYVAPGGGYTNVKPTGVDIHVQFLGIVTRSHASSGGGIVTGTGVVDHFRVNTATQKFEVWDGAFWRPIVHTSHLGELANVVLTNPALGEALTFDGTNWVNTVSGGGVTSHATLTDREVPDQHPISAITGLVPALDAKANVTHTHTVADLTAVGVDTGSLLISTPTGWEPSAPSPIILPTVGAVTHDISGFPNRTDTALTFDQLTRTVTLSPVTAEAKLYYRGTEFLIPAPLSVQWSDTNGCRYIIFDPTTGTLVEYGPTPDIRSGQVLVAYVYWNATAQQAVLMADERHGSARDTQWHHTQHRDVGASWRSGGALTFTTNDDTAVGLGVSSLTFADEDLEHNITDGPITTPYHQPLSYPAQLPAMALVGTAHLEHYEFLTGDVWKRLNGRAVYNEITNGVGSFVEAPSGSYINYWLVATNDDEYPAKLLMGRVAHDSVIATASEVLESFGLPFPEFAVMYRIILEVNDANIGNLARVRIVDVQRAVRDLTGGVSAISANSHDNLAGREFPDQHPISAITNLQATLDTKSNITHVHTLGSLSDVTLTTPSVGDGMYYDGTQWINFGSDAGVQGGGAAKRIWSNNIPSSSGTTIYTPGTTPPLVTDGTQMWSTTITPLSTTATYVIQTSVASAASQNNGNLSLVLFRDGVYIGGTVQIANSNNNSATLTLNITDKPNTTLPVTYEVRIGISSGVWYVNRRSSEVTYGGLHNGWVIWEY